MGRTAIKDTGSQNFLVRAYEVVTVRLSWSTLEDKGGSDSALSLVANSARGKCLRRAWEKREPATIRQALWFELTKWIAEHRFGNRLLTMDSGLSKLTVQAAVAGEKLLEVGLTNSFTDAAGHTHRDLLVRALDRR